MKQTDHLQTFTLTLTTRAPIHIGGGRSYTKKEYLFNPKTSVVSFLDMEQFFSLISEKGMEDAYESFVLSPEGKLYNFLNYECRVTPKEMDQITRWKVSAQDALTDDHTLKEIRCFIRNGQHQAYIPGSSVKGALRTVLLASKILREDAMSHSLPPKGGIPEGRYVNTLPLRKMEGSVLDDAVNSLLRGVSISDSLPISDRNMILANKVDILTSGEKRSPNMIRECVAPGVKLSFVLTLDQSVLQGKITKEVLVQAVQDFDGFYTKFVLPRFRLPSKCVAESYQNCLLLGGGAGFFSKTLVYEYLGWDRGLDFVSRFMATKFKNHGHERDGRVGISPHTLKYARCNGWLYPYGVCGVTIT